MVVYQTNPLPVAPISHIGASSGPGFFTSCPAPCCWPGKAVEDDTRPWVPGFTWESWKKQVVSGFRWAQLRLLWPFGGMKQGMEELSVPL